MGDLGAVLAAYAIGSIVFGVVLGKSLYGRDLRKGDNPGASGAVRTFGAGFGVIVGLLDVCKGVAAVLLARSLGATPVGLAASAAAAVAGHNWPVWYGFRGGGGLATASGALAVFGLRQTLIAIAIALLLAALYKHPRLYGRLPMSALPFGSLFGLPLLVWLFWRDGNQTGTLAAALVTLLIGVRALGMHAGSKRQPRNC